MKINFRDKLLRIFLLFLPLFALLSYAALLIYIGKRIREFNFKKIFVGSDFLFFNFVLLSLFITVLVSALLSPYRMISLLSFSILCFYLLVHFIMREATKRQGEKWFLNSIFLSLFFLCGFGIIQYLLNLNVDLQIWIFHLHFSRGEIGSLLSAKNKFAAYLVLTLPLILTSISWKEKSKRKNAFLFILLSLGLFSLVLTDSLGGIGAIGIIIVIYLLVKNWKVGLIVLGIGALVFLSFQNYLPVLIEKYSALEIRIYTWKNVCIPLIKDHPLLGTGIGTFHKIAPYYAPDALRLTAHNFYFQYLGEIGFCGAFFLFLSIGIPLIYLIKLTRHKNSPSHNLSFGLVLSIAGILIFCIIEIVMGDFQVGLLFWSLTGIGLGIYSRERMTNDKKES